ncbi:RIO kinase 1 [Panacagrimonas perspica]|uniref:non-specific serine/threonine protein kinase n=1 Tax=Panacagrimonas perspica TaxID=381431 RepID=A0A4S3KA95_9GAMM|nr:PA4780 family RIO1-like protein kinase [Panacagrimonas perspica]TDU32308.1 RIO kinase 1 [Panacagrimonas perspica]THD05250.1 serine protein kinase RIO [Panacagrimonas perspica]
MKIPRGLQPLIDDGIIDEVVRPLKSGKEAAVFLVASGDSLRCAKVYKDANHRGFQKLAQYQEGRKARGSRDERAMGKRSRHGRKQQEEEWKNAEVDALYRLAAAGVRVPRPYGYFVGVLVMEMIADENGNPAPRLNEVSLSPELARQYHEFMIRQIVLMLCAGLIHGDLSEYNVLLDTGGPVVIDLPQAVEASVNNSAFAMLARDVGNMAAYFGQYAPELLETQYAREIWQLYQHAELKPDTVLTGVWVDDGTSVDVDDVMLQIEEARREAERRQRGREEAAEAED